MTETKIMDMYQLYIELIMSAIVVVGADYYISDKGYDLKEPNDLFPIIDKLFEDLQKVKDIELLKKLREEFQRIDVELTQYFMKYAMPGDALYLKVYLATRIMQNRNYHKYSFLTPLIKNQNSAQKFELNLITNKPIQLITENTKNPKLGDLKVKNNENLINFKSL